MNSQNPQNQNPQGSRHAARSDGEFVTVSIYDQTYHLRGHDPVYIEQLAALVDSRMRAVASHGTTVDSLRVAVLAALNVADELLMTESRLEALTGAEENQRNRAHSLNGLLDGLLDEVESDSQGNRRRTG
jgi:cell division protein ZapA